MSHITTAVLKLLEKGRENVPDPHMDSLLQEAFRLSRDGKSDSEIAGHLDLIQGAVGSELYFGKKARCTLALD